MRLILLCFLILPIMEVWVLLEVGGVIGGLKTVALVVLTAFVGAILLRQQSLSTVFRARTKLDSGEAPTGELVEGVFLAVGGALLLTPGFITDAVGLACLLPGVRRPLVAWGLHQAFLRSTRPHGSSGRSASDHDSHTIEGEYHREDDQDRRD